MKILELDDLIKEIDSKKDLMIFPKDESKNSKYNNLYYARRVKVLGINKKENTIRLKLVPYESKKVTLKIQDFDFVYIECMHGLD